MDLSDVLSLVVAVLSLFIAIASIIIVVLTLKQNNRMLEASSRPYVTIYTGVTLFQEPTYYIILKNLGNSGATILSLKTDKDLIKYVKNGQLRPFDHIEGTFIAPGQSFRAVIDRTNPELKDDRISFNIKYKSNTHDYNETILLNLGSHSDLLMKRVSSDNKELKIISYTLQDLVEKHL